jgi:hypothetical protein
VDPLAGFVALLRRLVFRFPSVSGISWEKRLLRLAKGYCEEIKDIKICFDHKYFVSAICVYFALKYEVSLRPKYKMD